MTARAFEPRGLLALEPRAFGMLLMPEWKPPANEECGGVTIVNVRGPLMHHEDPCSDSYDAIKARVQAALTTQARAVVLRIDSPGGLVSGCFDAVREIRRMAEAAHKPLYAYLENACSAAFALACSCEKIFAAESGTVGSIGVIDTVIDVTALDKAQGVRLAIVTSGARKADSNPHTPLTDSKLAAAQASVNAVAGLFFALVAESRGLEVSAVQALEAATFPGVLAVSPRLIDATATFEETLAMVANGSAATAANGDEMDYEKAVAALRKVAEGDDANAKAAKRALAALDSDESKEGEGKAKVEGDDKKPEDKPEAKAEGDEEKKPEEKPEAKATVATSATAFDAKTLKAEIKSEMRAEAAEAAERSALLATRPDLSANMRAQFSTLPLATVKAMIVEMPKVATAAQAAIAGATADINPTKGANQINGGKPEVTNLSPYAAQLDREMGLSTEHLGVRVEGSQLILSASGAKAGK